MLNTSQFFSSLVSQYVGKYNDLAARFGAPSSSTSSSPSQALSTPSTSTNEAANQPALIGPRRDSAQLAKAPRLESPASDLARAKQDIFDARKSPAISGNSLPEVSSSVEGKDPATYSSSFKKLRYGLKMEFDMQAIQKTVYQLSSSQTADKTTIDESFEQLFSGGFGFSADMKLSGIAVNATATDSGRATESYRRNESIQQGREMQQEAEKTRGALPAEARQSYQVAVNQISLRYKTDTQFSFSNFSRFQSHVEQLNGSQPDSVEPYTSQAGALAQSAPNDVVGQFFDTVDGYLQNKEDSLIANAQKFFDVAAESLGLSAEAVNAAKASVTNRIESFFNSVESNLNGLESSFKQPISGDSSALSQTPVSIDGSKLSELAQGTKSNSQSMLDNLISAIRGDSENDNRGDIRSDKIHDSSDDNARGKAQSKARDRARIKPTVSRPATTLSARETENDHSHRARNAKEEKGRDIHSSKTEQNS